MKKQRYKPIFSALIISVSALLIHKLAIALFLEEGIENQFVYSISLLYCFFFAFSAIILFALIQIRQQNINNVGYTFLLLTSIKMAGAYFFLKPILNSHSGAAKIEKFHFFGIFILFLIIETIMSIKILNNKQ